MSSVLELIGALSNLKVGASFSYEICPQDDKCPFRLHLGERPFSQSVFSGRGKVHNSGQILLRAKFNYTSILSLLRKWIKTQVKYEPKLVLLQHLVFTSGNGKRTSLFSNVPSLKERAFFGRNILLRTHAT